MRIADVDRPLRTFVRNALCGASLGIFTLCCFEMVAAQDTQETAGVEVERDEPLDVESLDEFELRAKNFDILIDPGNSATAKKYYQRIGGKLNASFRVGAGEDHDATTMDGLLEYLGYGDANTGLTATDLEALGSFLLMPRDSTEFTTLDAKSGGRIGKHLALSDFWDAGAGESKILVSRFFAPKIATYYYRDSDPPPADPFDPIRRDDIVPGWRKVARVPARVPSGADDAGIKHAYILFNVKEPDPFKDPYLKPSLNNQVILVPKKFKPTKEDACYFVVYGEKKDGYPILEYLTADFDLPGHVATQVVGEVAENSKYYVPTSCASCHGHGRDVETSVKFFNRAKPNYLDTDQWYDWMEFDFRPTASGLHDVLFDGGKDHGTSDYERAFDVIGALNLEIRKETFLAEEDPNDPSFQTLAVDKWLELHGITAGGGGTVNRSRKPYSLRSIGSESWDTSKPEEARLLQILNNHCFRCHSSLEYNIFDRFTVGSSIMRQRIKRFITRPVFDRVGNRLPGYFMPQGRVLAESERDELYFLIDEVLAPQQTVQYESGETIEIESSNYFFTIEEKQNPPIHVEEGDTLTVNLSSSGGKHDWVLEDENTGEILVETARVSSGQTTSVTFRVDRAGTFAYYCSVGNHRKKGMEGEFVVAP